MQGSENIWGCEKPLASKVAFQTWQHPVHASLLLLTNGILKLLWQQPFSFHKSHGKTFQRSSPASKPSKGETRQHGQIDTRSSQFCVHVMDPQVETCPKLIGVKHHAMSVHCVCIFLLSKTGQIQQLVKDSGTSDSNHLRSMNSHRRKNCKILKQNIHAQHIFWPQPIRMFLIEKTAEKKTEPPSGKGLEVSGLNQSHAGHAWKQTTRVRTSREPMNVTFGRKYRPV